ncbi:hypothetical protein PVK06_048538 [Gossypium arboreum]|uniref:Uncharacterized protein n=1 Tax=Gossypium arboreum TaxID=29729 RepID=A0ABR0MG96_GOSAR|nr:hypothetical protein PVK06_048538 [Gossypium arboreum]
MTEKEEVSKQKTKSLNAKFHGLKQDMGQIKEDQRCIRDEQRKIRERLEDVRRQCDEVRLESEAIAKQSAFNRIRLVVMFQIIKAREDGDFDKAALLCRFLNSISDRTNHLFGSGKKKKIAFSFGVVRFKANKQQVIVRLEQHHTIEISNAENF